MNSEEDFSDEYSNVSSVVEVFHGVDWYRSHLRQSGRLITIVMASYITAIACFDLEGVIYDGSIAKDFAGHIVEIVFRVLFIPVAILVYLLCCRVYEPDLGMSCILVGALLISLFWVPHTGPYFDYIRIFVDLPIRYFGLAYIQAFTLRLFFSWSFAGAEQKRFFRLWILVANVPQLVANIAGKYANTMKFGKGLTLVNVCHGALLLGAGIIFKCGFTMTPSSDSVQMTKKEVESLEKDHMANGLLYISESSVFKPGGFLKQVLKDSRHLMAISVFSLCDISRIQMSFFLFQNLGHPIDGTVLISALLCFVFWIVVTDVIDIKIDRIKSLSKRIVIPEIIVLTVVVIAFILEAAIVILAGPISKIPSLLHSLIVLEVKIFAIFQTSEKLQKSFYNFGTTRVEKFR